MNWNRKSAPAGVGEVDWKAETSQFLRGSEFKKMYRDNYKSAYSTELAHATRTQLVSGYQQEVISKGRTLVQTSRADGVRNPHGVNLMTWH